MRIAICSLAICVMSLSSAAHELNKNAPEKIISLPWMQQKTDADCGRAVLASVAARKGGNPEKMYRKISFAPELDASGYSVDRMEIVSKSVNVRLKRHMVAPWKSESGCNVTSTVTKHFEEIRRIISSGRPVIVPVIRDSAPHYVALIGFNSEVFYTHDPAFEGQHPVPVDKLRDEMCHFAFLALEVR